MSGTNIGMMDPAYFVGRRAILDWINNTFQMNLAKIEETASGAVTCQILDAIYPGEVPMSKVRWDAKSPHEFIDNYKIIQQVFEKKGVDKHIEVERLMRAKYQDNLENMQWFKSFYEKNYSGQLYDPLLRRGKGKGAEQTTAFALSAAKRGPSHSEPSTEENTAPSTGNTRGTKPSSSSTTTTMNAPSTGGATVTNPAPKRMSTNGTNTAPSTANPGPKGSATTNASSGLSNSGVRTNSNVTSPGHSYGTGSNHQMVENYKQKINELTQMNNDLTLSVESLEKERDWYFSKLRDIEIMLQTYSGTDKKTVDAIFKILYATDDEFVTVDNNNEDNNTSNHQDQNVSQHSESTSPMKHVSVEG